MTVREGTRLGKYVVRRCVGKGGMAEVFEARHAELQRRVAVKVLAHNLANRPEVRSRFLQEGRSAAKIEHENVVSIFDVGEDDGAVYLVMEFLEGEDLKHHLKKHGALSVAETADLMLPVLGAVGAAHDVGLIHRDLKPANIFLTTDSFGNPFPKVLDFGISKGVQEGPSDLTDTGAVLGTPHYMSPEQARGKPLGVQSDVYSLGVIAYECVTGRRAFDKGSTYELLRSIVKGRFPPIQEVKPDLPVAFVQAINTAMAKDVKDRHATTYALGAALLPFATERAKMAWEAPFSKPSVPAYSATTPANVELREAAVLQTTLLPTGSKLTGVIPGRTARVGLAALLAFVVGAGIVAAGWLMMNRDAPQEVMAKVPPPPALPAPAPPPVVDMANVTSEAAPAPPVDPKPEPVAKKKRRRKGKKKKRKTTQQQPAGEPEEALPMTDNLNPWR